LPLLSVFLISTTNTARARRITECRALSFSALDYRWRAPYISKNSFAPIKLHLFGKRFIMKSILSRRLLAALTAFAFLFISGLIAFDEASGIFAQSRRQPPANQQRRRNQRPEENPTASPTPTPEPVPDDVVNTPGESDVIRTEVGLVNVDAVVLNRRTNQLITNLRRENFAIFEDDVRQDITFFSTPEAPITVAMVLEYSKLTDRLGGDQMYEPGRYEVLRPMAMFLSQYIRPPDDFVSVVAYDLRTTPLTDFTNDPGRIRQVIDLLLRNPPAFSEANLFDALQVVLAGGRADSVLLDRRPERTEEYAGLASLQGRRKAMILICSGVDTFSRINYGNARRVVQNSGVPIYIIGTANLFMARYGDRLPAEDSLLGFPGRMTMLQAQNALRTFARESGGAYFPVRMQGELPAVLENINAMLRHQYSLGYNPGNRRDGRQRRITVRVDVDGDGQLESERDYTVNARRFYNAPRADGTTRN
jgi:Ca-activated chloride channel homolog